MLITPDQDPQRGRMPSVRPAAWAPCVALTALAVAGHAATLALIDAPPYAVFQHYPPWQRLLDAPLLALVVVGIQAAVCVASGYRARRAIAGTVRQLAPALTLLALAGVLIFSSAVPTESAGRFFGEIVLSCGLMALAGLNLLLAARALPVPIAAWLPGALADRIAMSRDDTPRRWDRRLPLVIAVWVFAASAMISILVFERVPHIDDEGAYLFQAKYMVTGALWLPRPPDPESFGVAHLIVDGDKWYSKFFPGWPALLTIGVAVGAPWLINPLLAAVSILLTHHLIRRLYDRRTAHAVVLLLGASPWLLFLSGSLMAHATSLCWLLLALVAVEHQRGRPAGGWSLLAGAALGLIFLTRPFDAALVGPVVALWALGFGRARLSVPSLGLTAAAAAIVASGYLAYNRTVTGDAFLAPHTLWSEHLFGANSDVLGFGETVGIPLWRNADPLPGHGPADVLLNSNKNFFLINFELFGWAFGSLALACLAFQPGGLRRHDALMLAMLVAIVGGHVFYWAPGGPDFGARYWYLLIVPLTVLTVRGIEVAIARLARPDTRPVVAGRVLGLVALASLSAILTVLPWRALTKYHRYRDIGRDIHVLTERQGISNALVFVRSPLRSDYQAAFVFNPRNHQEPGNIFARELDEARAAKVLAHFPTRPVWIIGRGPDPGSGLTILGGPYPPGVKPPGPDRPAGESLQATIR